MSSAQSGTNRTERGLHPIVRRVRRPLVSHDEQAAATPARPANPEPVQDERNGDSTTEKGSDATTAANESNG
jgi:hypothetical protein